MRAHSIKIQVSIASLLVVTTFVGFVTMAVLRVNERGGSPIAVHPKKSIEGPLIKISRVTGERSASIRPYAVFSVWFSGKVIWREFPDQPDSRLLTTKVSVSEIDELFQELSSARLLDPDLQKFSVGFGSGYDTIEINAKEQVVELSSWHEHCEKSPNLVCMHDGLTAIAPDRIKQDYVDEWSRPYQLLRRNWDIIRDFSDGVIDRADKKKGDQLID